MTASPSTPTPKPQSDSSLAIISFVLSLVSIAGPGFILGIPAIVLAIISLKKKADGQNLSIAGLVIGIVSTIVSLIFVTLLAFLVVWGINHPAELEQLQDQPYSEDMLFENSRT